MVDQELLKQAEKSGNGAASTAWKSDRPRRTYYDPYGVAMVLPADSVSFQGYIEKGFTLRAPKQPEALPETMAMADGSLFDLSSLTSDDWVNRKSQQQAAPVAVAAGPTLTYWTREGTPLHGLPADPASMAGYLAAGLSLNPPEGADMAHETALYWNREGAQEGPLPSGGDWPEIYARRGYSLQPPSAAVAVDEPEADNLDDMKLDALKAIAGASGVDITGLKKKVDVVAAIRLAREAEDIAAFVGDDEDDDE